MQQIKIFICCIIVKYICYHFPVDREMITYILHNDSHSLTIIYCNILSTILFLFVHYNITHMLILATYV